MTTEILYDTLNYIIETDGDLQIQSTVQTINTALANLVQTPAQPTHQQVLASALNSLDAATTSLRGKLTPSRSEQIGEVGGSEFFDPSLSEKIRNSIAVNAMTPSVASTYVQGILTRRSQFLQSVKQTLAGLQELGITGIEVDAGHADITFAIPRELFDSKLDSFAKELRFISRLIQDVGEASTGVAESPSLETLSSSTPTVSIFAAIGAIKTVADSVKAFLDVWKQVQELRDARTKLIDLGLSGAAVEEIDNRITEVVDEVVETTTTMSVSSYPGDSSRRNELRAAIEQNMRRLFGQIERGLVVQVRAEPDSTADSETQEMLSEIADIGRHLDFPQAAGAPLLLNSGELIEGEIHSFTLTTKTTRTTTKTTGKKSPAKKPIAHSMAH